MVLKMKNVLILDIETKTFNDEVNPDNDVFKLAGYYNYNNKKRGITANLTELQKEINAAKYIVTFNGKFYDIPILERHGINFKYKYQIDLKEIIKKRAGIIKIPEGRLVDNIDYYSLDNILKLLHLSCGKTGMDYSILQKESKDWTEEEKKILAEYLFNDIEITKQLYEWVEKTFESFKMGLSDKDINGKKYLTTSPSVDCYKFICNVTGMKEEYENTIHKKYKGGWVEKPTVESAKGNILVLDFTSAYPSSIIQNNLFTLDNNGKNIFDLYTLKGKYNTDKRGKIETALLNVFRKRLEMKKTNNPNEFALKIRQNIIYGLSGNETFKSVYELNPNAASDCTLMVRSWVKLAKKRFEEAGLKFLYSDTDSNYLDIGNHSKEYVLNVRDKIINEIKENVIFPMNEFNMEIENEIKYIQFFMNKDETQLAKKHYLFVTKNDKLIVKGLQVIKCNTSKIAKHIFKKYITPEIIKNLNCKFSKQKIKDLIYEGLEKDIGLIATRFFIKPYEYYQANPTTLYAQISKCYGSGIHQLIRNKSYGVGKGVKYCKLDEFNGNMMDLDISQALSELKNFIKKDNVKSKDLFNKKW